MEQNILVIIGSPKGKKGNSESIGDALIDKVNENHKACTKVYLREEIGMQDRLIGLLDMADIIVLSFPIYENSTPGLVMEFFEILDKNKEKLANKKRKMLAMSNSGFADRDVNPSAIRHCRLFARDMGFTWMGGFIVSPGTIIDGKKLQEAGSTYKKVIALLNIIGEKISNDEEIPDKAFELVWKPLMPPFIYRFFGNMLQKRVAKNIGKDKYFAKPLM